MGSVDGQRGRTPEKATTPTSSTSAGSNGRRRYVGRSLTMDLNQQINAHFNSNSTGTTTSRRSSTSNSASSFTTQTKLSTLTAAFKVSLTFISCHFDFGRCYNLDLVAGGDSFTYGVDSRIEQNDRLQFWTGPNDTWKEWFV